MEGWLNSSEGILPFLEVAELYKLEFTTWILWIVSSLMSIIKDTTDVDESDGQYFNILFVH